MRLADNTDKKNGNDKPVKKWRELVIKTDQFKFAKIVTGLRKLGYKVSAKNRMYKLLDKNIKNGKETT